MVITLIVLGIVVVLVFYVISLYNNLVKLRNRIENAWAQIDVQLKRRWDLIPNLVETVKGYASHEKGDPRVGDRRPERRHHGDGSAAIRRCREHAHRCAAPALRGQ